MQVHSTNAFDGHQRESSPNPKPKPESKPKHKHKLPTNCAEIASSLASAQAEMQNGKKGNSDAGTLN